MKIHRFFVPDIPKDKQFYFNDPALIRQWVSVLRFRPGQKLVLFDGKGNDGLFFLKSLTNKEGAQLELVGNNKLSVPQKEIHLFWSLLKKDKNEWVLQKCTELGVKHFHPILADRSEKTGFNIERSQKIVTEAAEQCGRSDIPVINEPLTVAKAIERFSHSVPMLVCERGSSKTLTDLDDAGILVGPEGGWSDLEKQLFEDSHLASLSLNSFTLRAETACVAAAVMLLE